MMMEGPRLYTTTGEIAAIRGRMQEHDWYARCFGNLRAPVDELLRRGIRIPKEKGFVFYETCPADNTRLRHDPFDPSERSCPVCGTNYTDRAYYHSWVTFYQTWLAQRAVDMGIAYQVTRDPAYANAIRYILKDYATHYADYPLVDCVLGPTRLFESTYIESLWLANLAAAADFAAETIPAGEWQFLRDALFLPSAHVILDYDEGNNNRQAMNNAALGLVGILCDDSELVDHALNGPHGWMHHLEHSVLEDGLWYEGDNYHFATLPAMANLAEAVTRNGVDLYRATAGERNLKMMFDGPLLDLYPDLTFPARKDSRFGSTIGQRWYAGLYELAYRRYADPAYAGLLRTLYEHPPDESTLLENAAGFIDVMPAKTANREWLDWRGFLNAVPALRSDARVPVTGSVNMTGTGLGILRQDQGQTYASIDYGRYGGGHGHPDRLHLNFYARGKRWLTDWGTGNYFLDHLRWYRSAIAHNTVTIDGQPHQPIDGACRQFATTPDVQLIATSALDIASGVDFHRAAILLSPDLLLDLFTVEADRERTMDWAIHPVGTPQVDGTETNFQPATIDGEHYDWLEDVRQASATDAWSAVFRDDADALAVHMLGAPGTEIFTARAYGSPSEIPRRFPVLIARRTTTQTTFATLFEHRAGGHAQVASFTRDDEGFTIHLRDASQIYCCYDHASATATIDRHDGRGNLVKTTRFDTPAAPVTRPTGTAPHSALPPTADLGRDYALDDAAQVRRGERHWRGPDDLSARFRVDRDGDLLHIAITVVDDLVTCEGPVENPYDYDSVQVYFDPRPESERANRHLHGIYGLLLVPSRDPSKPGCVEPIVPGQSLAGVRLESSVRERGYDVSLTVPLERLGRIPAPGDTLGFDLIVNDNDGTLRRSLQMIWTGAHESRIWLRGDYHPPQQYGRLRM